MIKLVYAVRRRRRPRAHPPADRDVEWSNLAVEHRAHEPEEHERAQRRDGKRNNGPGAEASANACDAHAHERRPWCMRRQRARLLS